MRLPSDEIGVSDIIDYRECPQRFAYKMRRHTPLPERFQTFPGEKDEPPEHQSYATAYGGAIHDAIAIVDKEQVSDEEAIDRVWTEWQHWLEPDDIDRMRADLETFRTRTALGYRLVASEQEMRVPLFVHEGRQIFFRFRVDTLYQSIENAAVFMSRDYKSGRWPKSEAEVHRDLQQWAYNWGLHEMFPEMETLIQQYDQLRFGVIPTRKSPLQRQQIKSWLIKQVTSILTDERLKPTSNQWCQTCPIMLDCAITHRSADFWKNRLAVLAPERKEGRKVVVQLTDDHAGFEIYTDILPKIKESAKVMERFIGAVEDVLKQMPAEQREEYGYTLGNPRKLDSFDAEALRRLHQMVGDDFYHLAGITKKAVEDFYEETDDTRAQIMALATKKETAPPLKPQRKS